MLGMFGSEQSLLRPSLTICILLITIALSVLRRRRQLYKKMVTNSSAVYSPEDKQKRVPQVAKL
jgi:hypothetical protein